jgi:hypothetical protein
MSPVNAFSLRIFLLLFLTYVQFFQAATWGSACRLYVARALVERGTIRIDAYHENTGDKAIFAEHYYCDKAPLPSFMAVPGVAAAHAFRSLTGRPASEAIFLALMGGLASIFACGIVTAAGGVAFARMLAERGAPARVAFLATAALFLGSPLFPYATLLQGHAPAASWLLIAFHLWIPFEGVPSLRRAAAGGAAAACAVATEYPAAPPVLLLGLVSLLRRSSGESTISQAERARRLLSMASGALPVLIFLGAYHWAAYGSPFTVGYQSVGLPYFRKTTTGFLGINLPDVRIAFRLLFEPYRGLFPASPILIPACLGLFMLVREAKHRIAAACAIVIFIYYLALNAGLTTWHGGWAIGPRHMTAAIPLLGLGLMFALPAWPKASALAAGVSVLIMLAATAVGPEIPEDIANPYSQLILPRFFSGDLSQGEQGFGDLYPARLDPNEPDRWDAFLIGETIGLRGRLALLPIFAVWAALWPWGSGAWYKRWRRP